MFHLSSITMRQNVKKWQHKLLNKVFTATEVSEVKALTLENKHLETSEHAFMQNDEPEVKSLKYSSNLEALFTPVFHSNIQEKGDTLYKCPKAPISASINGVLLVNRHPANKDYIQSSSIKSHNVKSSLSNQSNQLILLKPV